VGGNRFHWNKRCAAFIRSERSRGVHYTRARVGDYGSQCPLLRIVGRTAWRFGRDDRKWSLLVGPQDRWTDPLRTLQIST